MKKRKNRVLLFFANISVGMLLLSACALDSESNIPLFICGLSLAYLALFIFANTRD